MTGKVAKTGLIEVLSVLTVLMPIAAMAIGAGAKVARIDIQGASRIPVDQILSKLRLHVGSTLEKDSVRDEVRRLYATTWFQSIDATERPSPDGAVILLRVVERPRIEEVRFEGSEKLSRADLTQITGLDAGKGMEHARNPVIARQLETAYHRKGFPFAKVQLLEGARDNDTRVVFKIEEGPAATLHKVQFLGQQTLTAETLASVLRQKNTAFDLGAPVDLDRLEEADSKLIDHYKSLGFLDARVARALEWSPDRRLLTLSFTVDEGSAYQIQSIRFQGNRAVTDAVLQAKMTLSCGKTITQAQLNQSVMAMTEEYHARGLRDARIRSEVLYGATAGRVDVSFRIMEEAPQPVGSISF